MNPIEYFFKLGEKVTKGDLKRKADFDYYLLWIMFIAFFTIFIDNLYVFFFVTQRFSNLGWAFVMVAILWFQYGGLKSVYDMRKLMKEPKKPIITESPEEMLKLFDKDLKVGQETHENI